MISTDSIATSGNPYIGGVSYLQVFHDQIAIRQFVKNTHLYALATIKRSKPQGTNTYRFWLINPSTFTAQSSILSEGVVPAEEAFNASNIDISYRQYGALAKLSDLVEEDAPFDVYAEAAFEFGRRFAEVIDLVVQNELNSTVTRIIFGDDSVYNTPSITTAMKLKASLVAASYAALKAKASPEIDGEGYVLVAHPYCVFDLLTESSAGGFVDIAKYSQPTKLFNGEIGKLYNVRIVQSANIAPLPTKGASNQDIYPVYVLGEKAYAIVEAQPLTTYVVANTASAANPLAQFGSVAMKTRFGVKIIKSDSIIQLQVSTAAIVR